MANTYMYEKMLATRHAETRHHIHLNHKPASIELSPAFVGHTTGKRGTLPVELSSRRPHTELRREATVW
jgi:hypothetical protein